MAQLDAAQRLARELANALGRGWHWKEPDESFPTGYVQGPDGRELGVSIETYGSRKGKVEIRGVLPRRDAKGDYFDAGVKAPSIGVGGDRGIDAIARDVQRRLLPDYEDVFARANEALARRNEYLAATTDSISAIVREVSELEWDRRARDESSAAFEIEAGGYGDIKAYGDQIKFEARLSRAQVVRMLKALAE